MYVLGWIVRVRVKLQIQVCEDVCAVDCLNECVCEDVCAVDCLNECVRVCVWVRVCVREGAYECP